MDDLRVADVLAWKGYHELIIQRGHGDYQMRNLMVPEEDERTLENGLIVRLAGQSSQD